MAFSKTAVKTAMGLVLAASPLLAVGSRAATITQSFTVTVSPAATLSGEDAFASTPFAEFNPADGTLTAIDATLTGNATWRSFQPQFDVIDAALVFDGSGEEVAPDPSFPTTNSGPHSITFAISGTDNYGPDLSLVTGTSTTVFDLLLFDTAGDTFATSPSGLTGSVTYDYTPAGAVPEPATWAMMLAGVFGLGAVLRHRRRHGPAKAREADALTRLRPIR